MGLRFDVEVDLALAADLTADPSTWTWTDITDYVMLSGDGGVSISRGRGPEQTQTPPSTCTLRLNNADGRFARLNPLGAYYGQLRKNTPLRVRAAAAGQLIRDTFTRTETDGWGTPDRGAAWTLTGTAANFDVTGGVGTIVGDAGGEWATTGTFTDVDVTCRVKASTLNGEIAVVARFTDASNHYSFEIDLDSGSQSLDIWVYDAGTPTQLATTAFTAAADTWYRMRVQCQGTALRMKVWDDGDPEPSAWDLETTDATHASGAVGCGAFNATGVKSFDDFEAHPVGGVRFVGYVSEWPPRWTHGQKHQWVPVRADGVLRRLQRHPSPVRSALYRAITGDQFNLVGYWPMETVALDSPVGSPTGVVKAAGAVSLVNDGPAGSAGAVRLRPPSSIVSPTDPYPGVIVLPLSYTPSSTNLTVGMWFKQSRSTVGESETGRNVLRGSIFFPTTGTVALLSLDWCSDPDNLSTGSAVVFGRGSPASGASEPVDICDGEWHHIVLLAQESGANVNVFLYLDDELVASAALSTVTLGTVLEVSEFGSTELDSNTAALAPAEYDIAHLAVYDGSRQADNIGRIATAGAGHAGETDVDRFNRICTEESIPFVTATGDGIALGPQPLLDPVAILRDGEAAGQGVLYEALNGGLAYQPVSARYNQAVALALDHDQGHIVAIEPQDDDLLTRNDVTVTDRNTGVSAQAVDEDSIAEVGRSDEAVTLNLADPSQAPLIASWRLRVGTVDEYRYPTVALALHKTTDLVADWLACDIGSRTTITNLPADITPDVADQIIEGTSERISSVAWDVGL